MASVTRKPQAHPKKNTKGRKKGKDPRQRRPSDSTKVPKKTMAVKRPLQGSSTKKTSLKTPSRMRKNARGPALFGHYHKLNKKLDRNVQEEAQDIPEPPFTSNNRSWQ
nr:uncharacterized protein CXorf51A-like [Dasypus novemcinctus]